jgi:hypothetical protein
MRTSNKKSRRRSQYGNRLDKHEKHHYLNKRYFLFTKFETLKWVLYVIGFIIKDLILAGSE